MSTVQVPDSIAYKIRPADDIYMFHPEILDALREDKAYVDPFTGHTLGRKEMITTLENYLEVVHVRYEKARRTANACKAAYRALDNYHD